MPTDDSQISLIREQFTHMLDLQQAQINALKSDYQHLREINESRLKTLECDSQDHESRLRSVTEGNTQFKLIAGIGGGAGLIGLIGLIRSLW